MHLVRAMQTHIHVRHSRVIVRVLSVNATQCTAQARRAALLHRHHPQQLGHAATPSRGAQHHEELMSIY